MSRQLKELERAINDPRKVKAATLLVEQDFKTKGEKRMTHGEIAEECGVSRQSLHNWRKDALFLKYMETLSEFHLAEYRSLADSQLMKLIRGGDNGIPSVKALELFYKIQGRLVERKEILSSDDVTKAPTDISDEEIEAELEQLQRRLEH